MRWVILPLVIVLIQLLSYGWALSLRWLISPWYQPNFKYLLITCLLISNALIVVGFLGWFRISIGWLSVLWLGFLSAIISFGLIYLGSKLGVHHALLARGLSVLSFASVIGFAIYNAYTPTVRHLNITIDKPMPAPVRVAVASDLHLGVLFGKHQLAQLQSILSREQVDILLMPGDIMDDDTVAFDNERMAEQFRQSLTTPTHGSVVSLGNHDLYRTYAYNNITSAIDKAGATLLFDTMTTITVQKDGKTSTLQLIGRYDDHQHNRLNTDQLVSQADPTLPIILLDHRPSQIEQNSQLPIDLQVSGHTHNGQVFPANFIVKAINRIGYGYEKINGTHFVVSSGFGFWGIPFRLGSQSEIWVIEISGKG